MDPRLFEREAPLWQVENIDGIKEAILIDKDGQQLVHLVSQQ